MLCYYKTEMLTQMLGVMAVIDMKSNPEYKPLILTSPKQRQGAHFERLALMFLQQQGLTLIAQNWQQAKVGEIDLIMIETGQAWSTLVFIEVRQRKKSSFGNAVLSVTPAKRRKIIKTAQYFLQHHPQYADFDCRFDVIAYDETADKAHKTGYQPKHQPDWLQGAFMASAW